MVPNLQEVVRTGGRYGAGPGGTPGRLLHLLPGHDHCQEDQMRTYLPPKLSQVGFLTKKNIFM